MSLTEKDYLKKYSIKIVIISRSRAKVIKTHELLPDYIEVVVPVSEEAEYRECISNPLILIPDAVKGLGNVRNWVLDNFKEETVIMLDDDISKLYCLTGEKSRNITDPEEHVQILINDAVMCKDLGAHLFFFGNKDIRTYSGTDPFSLCGWGGCVIGIVGRKYRFVDDYFKVDIDYALQNLLVDRVIWQDKRYYYGQVQNDNVGGNSIFRTHDGMENSVKRLEKRWGKYVSVKRGRYKNNFSIGLKVERKQSVKYE